jgi:catechol 2,3-dioxygenase-like lactoylglutathione lyase family enzyme
LTRLPFLPGFRAWLARDSQFVPGGPVTLSVSVRDNVPNRPVATGRRKLKAKRVCAVPEPGLTVTRVVGPSLAAVADAAISIRSAVASAPQIVRRLLTSALIIDDRGGKASVHVVPAWFAVSMHLEHLAVIVDDYDAAIAFFVQALGFELIEDSPALTTAGGHPKRWVVVRPPGAGTGLLLARADGERQTQAVGDQFAGRVGLFLRVDDFQTQYERMRSAGVRFVSEPRDEPYGRVVVFLDIAGNRWDLLGPP